MIVLPGAAVGDVGVVAVGEVEEAVRAEDVDGGTASSLEPSLPFCKRAAAAAAAVAVAVAVVVGAVVAVFYANYYDVHCLHSFLLPSPWYYRLPLHCPHCGSQGYQAGMAH